MEEGFVDFGDAVLLNSFEINGKRCRVYLHRGILVWETERSPYTRSSDISTNSIGIPKAISVEFRTELPKLNRSLRTELSWNSLLQLARCQLSLVDVLSVEPVHRISREGTRSCCSEPLATAAADPSSLGEQERKASEAVPPCHLALSINYAESTTKHRWRHRLITLKHTDPRQVASWLKTLRNLLRGFKNRPKRLLVFVNPFGGRRRGVEIYHKQVAPLLSLAGVSCNLLITQAPRHARDLILATPLDSFDGIVCVGGDGTFAEVLTALLLRSAKDANRNIDAGDPPHPPSLRLGVVPAGSTDTVAFCLHGTNDVETAVIHILLGGERGMDVCSVRERGELEAEGSMLCFTASLVSYGYLGDVIKDSEKFRWMGPRRYDYSGFKKFMANRGYEGEVRLLTCSCERSCEGEPNKGPRCESACVTCGQSVCQSLDQNAGEWRTVQGRFFMVNGANLSCACPRSPNGIAPFCHVGNGCVDVVLIRHTSIFNNIRLLLRLASPSRSLYDLPFVEVHRAHAFSFSVTPSTSNPTSVWNCDGELLRNPNIDIRVHRQLVRVFARSLPISSATSPSIAHANTWS